MQFKTTLEINQRDSMVEIRSTYLGTKNTVWVSDVGVRTLISWLKANKPDTLREIVCEECPEHMEYHTTELCQDGGRGH